MSPSDPTRPRQTRKSLFILPNLITFSNVFCGFYAMVLASADATDNDLYRAAMLIVFAMFFDLMDGRVARITRTQSAFGLQLDSLADVMSFGAAPALLIYRWSLHSLGLIGLVVAFLFVAAGAGRLARFNVLATTARGVPTAASKYIVGLPIPTAAGVLVSLVVTDSVIDGGLAPLRDAGFVAGATVVLGVLMVSNVGFRSFKKMQLNKRSVGIAAAVTMVAVGIALSVHSTLALAALLAAYITLGIVEYVWQIPRMLVNNADESAISSRDQNP